MSLVLTPLKTTFWWKTLYELPSRIIIWRSVNVFHESFKQKRSRFDCKNYFVKLKIKQISSEYLLQVHTISINTSKFHVSFNALLAVNFTRNENEISEFLYFWMKIVSKEILHHFFPQHMHIMTDPPAGGAGQTVGHKNAWKLDAQSSLTVPISQLSPFHFEYKSAIVRSKSLWVMRKKTQANSPFVRKQNLMKCWYLMLHVSLSWILLSDRFQSKDLWRQRRSTTLLSAPLCAGLAISLTDFSPCIVSPSSLSLLVLTATLPFRAFCVYDTEVSAVALNCFDGEWFT